MDLKHLTIVVPCYNEARRLNVNNFLSFLDVYPNVDFIFVNDGSLDTTAEILAEMHSRSPERTGILDLIENAGKAEAVRRGLLEAVRGGSDFIGYWDADLATPLEEIPRFFELLNARPECQLVMGARVQLLGRNIQRSVIRHYAGRVSATLTSIVLACPVYDTQCGAKLMRTDAVTLRILEEPFMVRWIFDVELLARLLRAHQAKLSTTRDVGNLVVEIPLKQWSDVAGSKITFRDALNAFVDIARIHRKYRLRATLGLKP